ncbi:MAG: glycosyltransferase, partial [Candidatus Moraniibacteriota bacterium]
AEKNIKFTGEVDDAELEKLYAGARALIQPSDEDFGLAVAEALLYGTPAIAYGEGAVREIIKPGVTGEFFHAQVPEVLADGVHRFIEKEGQYREEEMKETATRFSSGVFQESFEKIVGSISFH